MEIMVYEEIGYTDWDGNGLTALSFNEDLNKLSLADSTLDIRINSMGGLVGDGIAMYNSIRSMSRKRASMGAPIIVNTHIDGFAYSSAATVAMAGDNIIMGEGTSLMIHPASSIVWGDSVAMRAEADRLDKYNQQIAGFYSKKSGMKLEDVLSLMDEETYFTPEEAVAAKMATSVAANTTANFGRYKPDDIDLLKGLRTNRQYDTYMRNCVRAMGVDKRTKNGYTSSNEVDVLLLELDLEEMDTQLAS